MNFPPVPDDLYHFERLVRAAGHLRVIGIDEAGRGPLAGPVVVAAVCLPVGVEIEGVNDSKQLTAARREVLYERIMADERIARYVLSVEVEIIDRLNIYQATVQAMRDVALAITPRADFALIDGLPVRAFPIPSCGIVKGDGKVAAIAAASILAKVHRDRLMEDLHTVYPQYGFAQHKGYGTAAHLAALRAHGPCPAHRRSYAPVAALLPGAAGMPVQGDFDF